MRHMNQSAKLAAAARRPDAGGALAVAPTTSARTVASSVCLRATRMSRLSDLAEEVELGRARRPQERRPGPGWYNAVRPGFPVELGRARRPQKRRPGPGWYYGVRRGFPVELFVGDINGNGSVPVPALRRVLHGSLSAR